jgi:hypothetical protein
MSVYIVTFTGFGFYGIYRHEIVGLFHTEKEAVLGAIDFLEDQEQITFNGPIFNCNNKQNLTVEEIKEIITYQSKANIKDFKKVMKQRVYVNDSYTEETFSFYLRELPEDTSKNFVYAVHLNDPNFTKICDLVGLFSTEAEAVQEAIDCAYSNDMLSEVPNNISCWKMSKNKKNYNKDKIKRMIETEAAGSIKKFYKLMRCNNYFHEELESDTFVFEMCPILL